MNEKLTTATFAFGLAFIGIECNDLFKWFNIPEEFKVMSMCLYTVSIIPAVWMKEPEPETFDDFLNTEP